MLRSEGLPRAGTRRGYLRLTNRHPDSGRSSTSLDSGIFSLTPRAFTSRSRKRIGRPADRPPHSVRLARCWIWRPGGGSVGCRAALCERTAALRAAEDDCRLHINTQGSFLRASLRRGPTSASARQPRAPDWLRGVGETSWRPADNADEHEHGRRRCMGSCGFLA